MLLAALESSEQEGKESDEYCAELVKRCNQETDRAEKAESELAEYKRKAVEYAEDSCSGCTALATLKARCAEMEGNLEGIIKAIDVGEAHSVKRIPMVVCTTMHLDHNPQNCADDNLRFACQLCHNRYDAQHRADGWYDGLTEAQRYAAGGY